MNDKIRIIVMKQWFPWAFLLIFFFNPLIFAGGFGPGILVKTPSGYTAIEKLTVGDEVCSLNEKLEAVVGYVTETVSTKITNKNVTPLYDFFISGNLIFCGADQKFLIFGPDFTQENVFYLGAWLSAQDISQGLHAWAHGEDDLRCIGTKMCRGRIIVVYTKNLHIPIIPEGKA